MKRGTKIGWLLVAVSIIMCVWVIASQSVDADQTIDGFLISDSGEVQSYSGAGGNITIPGEATSIKSGALSGVSGVVSVTIPDTVTSMGTGVFSGCADLQSVHIGSGITSIPASTFYECNALSDISIPESITSIGSKAFYGCNALTTITIPTSVSSLSTDAFSQCNSLANISVAAGNPSYKSADGCLYNGSGSKLLLVPVDKTSVSLAAGTITIGSGAMQNSSVGALTIPNSVTTIESNAFSGSAIEKITIPSSVTSIGAQSGWTPDAIYGYADTAAEKYAKDYDIPFYVIGNEGGTDEPSDPNQPGDDPNQPGNDPNQPGDNPNQPGTSTDNGSGNTTPGATGGASGASGGASGTAGGAHVKDVTPTTADGIDPRFFLCFAIFAGGVGVIMVSRINKLKYVSDSKRG